MFEITLFDKLFIKFLKDNDLFFEAQKLFNIEEIKEKVFKKINSCVYGQTFLYIDDVLFSLANEARKNKQINLYFELLSKDICAKFNKCLSTVIDEHFVLDFLNRISVNKSVEFQANINEFFKLKSIKDYIEYRINNKRDLFSMFVFCYKMQDNCFKIGEWIVVNNMFVNHVYQKLLSIK